MLVQCKFLTQETQSLPMKPYSRHKNRDSMYHGSKVIAKNLFRLLPMSAILDFVITKMPSGCNHYTHLIRKLHGIETPKMQRKDCYQAKQGFEEILACATRLIGTNFSEISMIIFSFKKIQLKMSTGKFRPFWLGLNVLMISPLNLLMPWCCQATTYYLRWCSLSSHNSLRPSDAYMRH